MRSNLQEALQAGAPVPRLWEGKWGWLSRLLCCPCPGPNPNTGRRSQRSGWAWESLPPPQSPSAQGDPILSSKPWEFMRQSVMNDRRKNLEGTDFGTRPESGRPSEHSSNFPVHTNRLKTWLKCRLGLGARGRGSRSAFLRTSQVMLMRGTFREGQGSHPTLSDWIVKKPRELRNSLAGGPLGTLTLPPPRAFSLIYSRLPPKKQNPKTKQIMVTPGFI